MATRTTASGRTKPLFGRAEIREGVLRHLDAAKGGTGSCIVLVGEGGVGKTTLLRTITDDARERGFQVLEGVALPADPPQPFAIVQDIVRSARTSPPPLETSGTDVTSLPLLLAPVKQDSADLGPPLGFFETRYGGESEDVLLARLAGPAERVDENRIELYDRVSSFLSDLASRAPLLLAIDDLHFADDSSFQFLREFVRILPERRIVLVATSMPESEAPTRTASFLSALRETPGVGRIPVRALSENELPEYVRWLMGGHEPSRDAVVRWFTQTEGNPLFVEQLVRGSMGFGPSPPVARADTGLRDLEEVLRDRVRSLSENDRRVLVYSAVLGKEFDFPTLLAAAGLDEEQLAESLDRLVRGGLLRENGGEVYEFVREAVRAEAYAGLTETRRRILHRKAALAIEQGARDPESSIFELARQFYLAHDETKALDYNRRAAQLATATFAYDAAIVHLQRALECARRLPHRDPATELRLMIELGRILDEFGDLHRSEEVLRDAVNRARTDPSREPDLGLALLWLARDLQNQGLNADARALGEEAFAIFERRGNQKGILVSHRVLGAASMRLGEFDEAERHNRQEVALAEKEGDSWERGHSLIDLANTLITRGPEKTDEALRLYDTAAELFAQSKDYAALARVHMNRSLVFHNVQRMDEAIQDISLAGEAAERSGSRIWMGYCALNEAQLRAEVGQIDRGRAAIARARHLLEPLGDHLAETQIAMIEGIIAHTARKYDEARERYEAALQKAREIKLKPETSEIQLRLATLAMDRGDVAEARSLLQTALDSGVASLHADLNPILEKLQQSLAS
jgi:tetratricopeptide (TPR) repeat protein/GTPase SAR1 family protein